MKITKISSRQDEQLERLDCHQCRSCIHQPDPWSTCGRLTPQQALVVKCAEHTEAARLNRKGK